MRVLHGSPKFETVFSDLLRRLPLLASCSLPSTRAKCEIDAIRDLSARE
jgi:hypothetical protein